MKPIDPSSPRAEGVPHHVSDFLPSPTVFSKLPSALALLGAGVSLALPGQGEAATFTVTNLNDDGAGSLRQALADANGAAGADVVDFQAGLGGTITLASGQLRITDSVAITGPGASSITVSGGNASRVFYLYNSTENIAVTISGLTVSGGSANIGGGILNLDEDLTLQDMAITGNTASGDGGGLWADGFAMDLVLRNVEVSGNTAGDDGGGIYIEDTGAPLLFDNVRITGNTATGNGGGVYFYDPDRDTTIQASTISGNSAGDRGGGVYLYSADGGVHLITGTTISGNTAARGGGAFFYSADHPLTLENCTISGNQATAGDGGGAYFYDLDPSIVAIRHTTVANNTASGSGGGLFSREPEGALPLSHVIIGDNNAGTGPDLAGPFELSFSLLENIAGAALVDSGGNLTGQDPQLGALANNAGPTQTHRLASTSPALNAGNPAFAPPPASDQRGQPRVAGGRIDLGAVELQPGALAFSAESSVVDETAGTLSITVTRTGGSEGSVSVDYATGDASALAGSDYTAATGTLTFADGDSEETLVVPITDDCLVEAAETFTVTLSNPGGGATLGSSLHQVTIDSDDTAGTLQFSSPAYTVAENAGSATIQVTRSGGSGGAVTVNYATSNGTATAAVDYTAAAGTLNFACGSVAVQSFQVPLIDDAALEADETVNLTLSAPSGGAALGVPAGATLTITNDDAPVPGTLQFSVGAVSVNEGAGTATVTVTRTGGNDGAVSVNYATVNGTAAAPGDYTAVSGTLSWPAGDSAPRNIVVPITNDALFEPSEAFTITLSGAGGGATLGATSVQTITINDDDVAAPGTLQFTAGTMSVNEADGTATVTVTRSGGSDGAVSVNYATANGTATAPADYAATAGTLNWPAGDGTSRTIVVPIVNDGAAEPDESFTLTLTAPGGGATLGGTSLQTITILDNDGTGVSSTPITIDATGTGGKLALGGLLGVLGALALRRRGLVGAMLACGLAFGAMPDAAQAAERTAKVGQVQSVAREGDTVHVTLADGSTIRVDAARLQVVDKRGGAAHGAASLERVRAGNWVRVVSKPSGAQGRHQEVKISLHDSRERAERKGR